MLYDCPYCGKSLKEARLNSPIGPHPRYQFLRVRMMEQCPYCLGAVQLHLSDVPFWWGLGGSLALLLVMFSYGPLLSRHQYQAALWALCVVQLFGGLWIHFWYLKSWQQYKKCESPAQEHSS